MRIIKLIVVSLQRCVLYRKVTLRTLCTYNQYLRTLFMERRPDTTNRWRKWLFVTYISEVGYQCFVSCFCHPAVLLTSFIQYLCFNYVKMLQIVMLLCCCNLTCRNIEISLKKYKVNLTWTFMHIQINRSSFLGFS